MVVGVALVMLLTLGATPGTTHKGLYAQAGSLKPAALAVPERPVIVQTTQTPQSPKAVVTPRSAPLTANAVGLGSIVPGFNCVACVKAMTGRSQNGNAGTWKASSSTPSIGAIMIWRPGQQGAGSAGHVGVVVGIHGNKVSVKHCNWGGGQTEFYSTGLFW